LDILKTNIVEYFFPADEKASDKPLWLDAAAEANIPKERVFLFSQTYNQPTSGIKAWTGMIGS
jgi:hypothetical protein